MSNGDWEHRIEKIENTVNKTQADMTELKLAICGSDKIGLKGLAKRVEKNEKYIDKDKKQKWMIAGGITILSTIIAFILKILPFLKK